MLKTVQISANSKTGPIAVTYRSGEHENLRDVPYKLQPSPEKRNRHGPN